MDSTYTECGAKLANNDDGTRTGVQSDPLLKAMARQMFNSEVLYGVLDVESK